MNRLKRMTPIARLAAEREREAARALATAVAALASCRDQLGTLRGYREEYERGFVAVTEQGTLAARAAKHRNFLHALDEAIDALLTRAASDEREVVRQRQAWVLARRRADALANAMTRFASEARGVERRREQRALDEHRRNAGAPGASPRDE